MEPKLTDRKFESSGPSLRQHAALTANKTDIGLVIARMVEVKAEVVVTVVVAVIVIVDMVDVIVIVLHQADMAVVQVIVIVLLAAVILLVVLHLAIIIIAVAIMRTIHMLVVMVHLHQARTACHQPHIIHLCQVPLQAPLIHHLVMPHTLQEQPRLLDTHHQQVDIIKQHKQLNNKSLVDRIVGRSESIVSV